ncbi:hypothetical protein FHS96_005555 [Sphingomonas zeicaulis]|uniref:hypothetical protein n=1 Tax=Sphingomonas zeicaulis TaxID=1632740 RepID=UPI003D1AC7B1
MAEQLIASIGGLTRMAIVADPETIQFFDGLARRRRVHDDGSSEEYSDRTATIAKLEQLLKALKKKRFGGHRSIEQFVKPACSASASPPPVRTASRRIGTASTTSAVRCERCFKRFDFPQGQVPKRCNWKYRVVGPFATPHHAQGGDAVGLTRRFLEDEMSTRSDFTFTTGLELATSGATLETDFFAWHRMESHGPQRREPLLFVGECKTFSSHVLKPKDIDRLISLGTALPGAYLVVANLKERLSAEDVRALRRLCRRWGWQRGRREGLASRVVVLTGHELFGFGGVSQIWEEAGGALAEVARRVGHIASFERLADATQQAHLGFSDEEMIGMRYGRAALAAWQTRRPMPASGGPS